MSRLFEEPKSFGESQDFDTGKLTLSELDGAPFEIKARPRRVNEGRARQFQSLAYDLVPRAPYKSLADVVLGANQDVKFHRTLTNRKLAEKYAKGRRLRLGDDKDYNNDGVNDVILFNKFGDPVVINGYALANTEYPYRQAFYEENPKKSDRMRVGGYNKWIRESFIPQNKEVIEGWSEKGIKARGVRDVHSVRADINQGIKNRISDVLKATLGDVTGDFVIKLLPWFQIYSYVYDAIILRYIITDKAQALAKTADNLEDFKKLLKKKNVKDAVSEFLASDECSNLLRGILTVEGVLALGNMIAGGSMDKFVAEIKAAAKSPDEFSTNPELRAQKQIWKETLSDNVDTMRANVDRTLGQLIASIH